MRGAVVLGVFVLAISNLSGVPASAGVPEMTDPDPAPSEQPADLSEPVTWEVNVVGGQDADPGEYPHAAALTDLASPYQRYFCSGALIHPSWVVTAAHCVASTSGPPLPGFSISSHSVASAITPVPTYSFSVVLGKTDLSEPGGEGHDVAEIIIHPDYVPPNDGGYVYEPPENDIALVRLTEPSAMRPIALPRSTSAASSMVMSAGWGIYEQWWYDEGGYFVGNRPTMLQELAMTVLDDATCNQLHHGGIFGGDQFVEDTMLCARAAGTPTPDANACLGDSGSALAAWDPAANSWRHLGVLSYGPEDCHDGDPGAVFTETSAFTQWLVDVTGAVPPPDGGQQPPEHWVGQFSDDDDSIFEADIEWMAAEGITKGCNPPLNDLFCPDASVTRGQMAAFLVRALGLTDDGGGDLFTDDDNSVFRHDIDKLAAAGITKGCNPPDNDRFCPDSKVTREQMAAFLVRALGYSDDGGGNLFIDDDDSIFERDIDRLATAGVTKGCNPPANDMFCPDSSVTRGQMAAFLHRALG